MKNKVFILLLTIFCAVLFVQYSPAGNVYINGVKTLSGAFVGGTIDNTIIGGTTPTAGSFTTLDSSGAIHAYNAEYIFIDEFDQGNAADAVDEIGAHEAYWTVGGANENDMANFNNGVGGNVVLTTANSADNDSTYILGEPVIATDSNPIIEFRFKVDNIVDAIAMVGLATAAAAEMSGTPCTDCIMVGLQEENGVSADAVILGTNDSDGGGMTYQDMLVNVVNNTWVIVRFDITDTEQPRVWVNGTEVAAGQITGTVKAAQTLMIYAHVQVVAAGPIQRTMTIDYIKVWQDRG